MARPTNVEPKDGEAGQERGENASVQIEDQQKSPGSETSGKDAGDVQEESTSLTKEGSKDATAEATKDNASKDGGTASDNDTGERPVREKLRETSIAGIPNAPLERAKSPDDMSMASQKSGSAADGSSETSSVDGKARSTKKRSFDDVQPEDPNGDSNTDEDTAHRRKRSRESTPGDSADDPENHVESDTKTNDEDDAPEKSTAETKTKDDSAAKAADDAPKEDEDARQKLLSPRKKRSRDQFDIDLKEDVAEKNQDGKATGQDAPSNKETPADSATKDKGEPEKKRHRDNSQERATAAESNLATAKIPSTNAFSNSSEVSPFASLASSKSPPAGEKSTEPTSSSAFASSSLAAFAGSEKSPFSSLSGSSPSGFGSAGATDSKKTEPTGFAAAASTTSGASPFASTGTSGFGKLSSGAGFSGGALGSGFAAASQPGQGLTSFAAPSGSGVLGSGSSKAKPFGAPADGEEEKDENKDEKPGFEGLGEEEKEDDRFFKQDTETGEESEETQFVCKAKLFHFNGKEWKERGIGNFKLNVTKGSGENPKITARLIMRADGALRVILNTPVFKGMTVGDAAGDEPTSKQVHLASLEDGRSVPLLLRTGSNDHAKQLYKKIELLKEIL